MLRVSLRHHEAASQTLFAQLESAGSLTDADPEAQAAYRGMEQLLQSRSPRPFVS